MRLSGIQAVTLDFGNTLVPIERQALHAVVTRTADHACAELGFSDAESFLVAWREERERQFREEVPLLREVDLPQRAIRVLARLRGMATPGPSERWDDELASARSTATEISAIVDGYSDAFVELIEAPPASGRLIHELADRGFIVAILSNWPLATTIDRFAAAAGWLPALHGIYVSQRIGTIKPNPAIFAHAAAAMGVPGRVILHVGDDWNADVEGALGAGWRAAYLVDHRLDTPLPTSARVPGRRPDLELRRLHDLADSLGDPPTSRPSLRTA